jgi:hypothetical protein
MSKITLLLAFVLAAPQAGCRDSSVRSVRKISGPPCSEEELPETLEMCARGRELSRCKSVPEEQGEACQAGCVMEKCQDTTPDWIMSRAHATSCGDPRGPVYWRNFIWAVITCEQQPEQRHGRAQPALGDCTTAAVEKQCPELAGTDWAKSWPGRYR